MKYKFKFSFGIVMLLLMCSLSLVSAELPHQQNTDLNFSITSNFATSCELTTINAPTGVITIEQTDTSIGTFDFSILGGNFTSLGTYCMNIVCTDGTDVTTGEECREVTPTGDEMNGWKITIQIFASLSTLFLMGLFLFLSTSGMKTDRLGNEEKPILRFFFVGISLIFLVAHIIITNIIIHDTLGTGTMAGAYTNVMYVFFTIIVLSFLYALVKIITYEMDVFQRRCGLK